MIRLGIIGVAGKMGRKVLSCILQDPDVSMVCGIVERGSSWIGKDVGALLSSPEIGTPIQSLDSPCNPVDIFIDFSSAPAAISHVDFAAKQKVGLVIGTTGLSQETLQAIAEASHSIPILMSPNFSLGMAACLYVSQQLAKALTPHFIPYIQETHHRHKKDKPSGTALALAEAIQKEGDAQSQPIDIHSIRSGEVIGDHKVSFYGDHEKIELSHSVFSRDTFALGALAAAKFLYQKQPGLYSLQDLFFYGCSS